MKEASTKKAAAPIPITPAARPSSPSTKFTALTVVTTRKTVTMRGLGRVRAVLVAVRGAG